MDNLIKTYELDKLVLDAQSKLPAQLDQLPIAVYTTNREGDILHYNRRALKLWTRVPVKGHDKWCALYDLYTPEGKFVPRETCAMAQAAKHGKILRGIEAIAVRPDGTAFRFLPFPTPLYDGHGELVGAVNMVIELGDVDMILPKAEIEFQSVEEQEHAFDAAM